MKGYVIKSVARKHWHEISPAQLSVTGTLAKAAEAYIKAY
jgi:hypothetical protein